MTKVIILAPLFTQAERIWNRALKDKISEESDGECEVTLPQDEAAKFVSTAGIDFDAIAQRCFDNAESYDVAVAILDGADSDSGTCIEMGWRKGRNPTL